PVTSDSAPRDSIKALTDSFNIPSQDLPARVSPPVKIILPDTLNAYFLSPTGSDVSGNGTLSSPWFTLNKAWTVVKAGDIVYMRGGNYHYPSGQKLHNKSGEAGNMIRVWAMPGE